MIIGLIISGYITFGILFAMYLIRRNIRENDGEFYGGIDDGAYAAISLGSIFWPIGIPIYTIIKLITWWTNYNENKYSSYSEEKICCNNSVNCVNCPLLSNDGLHCLNEHNCKFLKVKRHY